MARTTHSLSTGLLSFTSFMYRTGAFLYVPYSFLLISNKCCDLSVLRCTVQGGIKMWGGGAQCGKKNALHWALEAHVHKTTNVPLL
jgi:hypothetical protein